MLGLYFKGSFERISSPVTEPHRSKPQKNLLKTSAKLNLALLEPYFNFVGRKVFIKEFAVKVQNLCI